MYLPTKSMSAPLQDIKEHENHTWISGGNRAYFLAIIGAVMVTGFFVARYLDFLRYPFEDAAILMRYALHLAQGYRIVWNVGAAPVDGGTDFLYMVVLAAIVKAGLTVEIAARLVGIVSHLLTVFLVYFTIIKLHRGNRWLALLSATYLAIGPALVYISAYFGTPFFALFACITWYLANKLVEEPASMRASVLFAFSGLVMGLIRPEGVILALLMLLAIVYMNGIKKSQFTVIYFFLTFLLLGGLYFLWRWTYFGYPLPNPFYKKGGGHLYFSSLLDSIRIVVHMCGPFALAFILGFRSRKTVKQTIFLLIPTIGFTVIWILLSGETNYLGRFQYAILPVVLMSWPALVKDIHIDWKFPPIKTLDKRGQLIFILLIGCICYSLLSYQSAYNAQEISFPDGKYDVAVMLRSYSQKHYTMATTEAGLLPLYSNWRDVDTWGLNDQWIAHNGQVTEAYLDSYKPELIMFHASFSQVVPIVDRGSSEVWFKNWFPMLRTLKHYAETHGYILAADFGVSPYDSYYYYVRSDFPDSGDIIRKIQHIDYYSFVTGEKCVNYALMHPTQP
jgi:arabinofuranosyltransferase